MLKSLLCRMTYETLERLNDDISATERSMDHGKFLVVSYYYIDTPCVLIMQKNIATTMPLVQKIRLSTALRVVLRNVVTLNLEYVGKYVNIKKVCRINKMCFHQN